MTGHPLSAGQQRLWLLQQVDPASPAYNVLFAVRFPNGADPDVLRVALTRLIARHEILRTCYTIDAVGIPRQTSIDDFTPEFARRDEEPDTVAAIGAELAASSFDLAAGPPLRLCLVGRSDGSAVLLAVVHHIACDGRSLSIFARDLAAFYEAELTGTPDGLPALDETYRNYVAAQQKTLAETGGDDLDFWAGHLAGFQPTTLPAGRGSPTAPRFAGDTVRFELSDELTRTARIFALRQRASLPSLVVGAFEALLASWTGQRDAMVGSVLAGRGQRGFDEVIGFFVNTVTLRQTIPAELTFRELVKQSEAMSRAAFVHQGAPFDQVVAAVAAHRDPDRNALFDIVYGHDGELDETRSPSGIGRLDLEVGVVRFDLEFKTRIAHGRLDCSLIYRQSAVDRGTMESFGRAFVRLLESGLAEPDRPLAELDLLDGAERARILAASAGPVVPVAVQTVPELFAAQAARTPHAVALIADDGTELSYADVESRIRRLAAGLRGAGVQAGDVVVVRMARSVELVLAVHAIHRAAAAYLPIDPGEPDSRMRSMLDEAGPRLVLSAGDVRRLEETAQVQTQLPRPAPEDLAYIIYTSGSTGRPKGVAVSHRSVVNRLVWMADHCPTGPGDRVLLKTPVTFDVSVPELFGPMSTGAALVVASPDGHRDPRYLAETIVRRRITQVHFVPSMLRVFLAEPGITDAMKGLRRVFCSGEALSGELAARFHELADAELHNLYGPTEAAVEVSYQPCTPADPPGPAPIGRPVWNTSLYVLDAGRSLVPTGAVGELYIAGVQVAAGYLARPDLTAERFVPDPYGPAGATMYRTGDLVRRDPEGLLHYLGRIDDQVKVNGLRIELAEIDAVLAGHPGVAEAVTVARSDGAGGGRLVGYLRAVPGTDAGTLAEQVRQHALDRLPAVMVPNQLVPVDEIPTTPSGKLDRSRLPEPLPVTRTAADRPLTPREQLLAGLFTEVLGVAPVDATDDFFHRGGHSLLGIRLLSRIRAVFGVQLSIRTLFEASTVEALADRLSNGDADGDPFDPLLPLALRDGQAPLFCVHPAAGSGWVYSSLLRHVGDRPVYALQHPGLRTGETATVGALADVYVGLIRSVQPSGPYHLLGWSFGGLVAQAMATRLRATGDQVATLALVDSYPLIGYPQFRPLAVEAGDALRLLAESLGSVPPPGPLDHPAFVALMKASGSPLADLNEDQVAALARVFAGSTRMSFDHQPDVFDGRAVLFRATEGKDERSPRAADWDPYITGGCEVHDVPGSHGDMMHGAAPGRIGAVLAARPGFVTERIERA